MLQRKFKLSSEMQPKGDQPQAIDQLVEGLKKNLRHQVLLGATGTGKSVTGDTPVYLYHFKNGKYRAFQRPIGDIVDSMLCEVAFKTKDDCGTEVADASLCPSGFYVPSLNPHTGVCELKKITAYQRHKSPSLLYRLVTTCGREIQVTGDHNFYVLRKGKLVLVRTEEILETDRIPLPVSIENLAVQEGLSFINLFHYLDREDIYIEMRSYLEKIIQKKGKWFVRKSLASALEKAPDAKLHGILNFNERVTVPTFKRMSEEREGFNFSSRLSHNRFPTPYPLSSAFLKFLGLYIAEGHKTSNYLTVSVREEPLIQNLKEFMQELHLTFSRRQDGDFQINDRALATLIEALCGRTSFYKHLPHFWPELSLKQLGELLSLYFTGDGWVDRSAVKIVTASSELASQLLYALQRFGIWARSKKRFMEASNSKHCGNFYYEISISGQDNLHRFSEGISFQLDRKNQKLKELLSNKRENTNVDLVPGAGLILKIIRQKFGLSQRELGNSAGLSRGAIGLIEQNFRSISRRNLERIVRNWSHGDCEELKSLKLLSQARWASVKKIKKFASKEKYVYDFSVDENETFLAGYGGMFVHNTFTIANVIERVQRPTLVIAHNKTLAAQLCSELKEVFPDNAVCYFVSYYDYYQPEAYIPHTDTYIEKDAQINDEINKYRHKATESLLTRRDTIVVASVSCIYGLGSPKEYLELRIVLQKGDQIPRDRLLRQLTDLQYLRAAMDFKQGMFHVLGDVLEIFPPGGDTAVRVEFWDEEIERITEVEPFTGEILGEMEEISIFPAKHAVTTEEKIKVAVEGIRVELDERVKELEGMGKMVEAQRLRMRTEYDIEILLETGYCTGIENYVRYFNELGPKGRPSTLLEYFPKDFLMVIDESHMTVPQVGGMYNGNLSRKKNLVEHGFRLPSAHDNRPLRFEEFEEYMRSVIYVSATPASYEMGKRQQLVEQIIRPTGLVDPEISVRPKDGQIDDLLSEIQKRTQKGDRVLVTTLTKRSAEDLTEYLTDAGVKVRYLHSDIETLERIEILRDLRLGQFDVLVGINLLREGLDLPEVSLVAILDADKEGFLRSTSALIQTIGRAARNADGFVIMYAEKITAGMRGAIEETERRRSLQTVHNKKHGITPQTIRKAVKDIEMHRKQEETKQVRRYDSKKVPKEELFRLISSLEDEMDLAAQNMEFEKAAVLRDEIEELRGKL